MSPDELLKRYERSPLRPLLELLLPFMGPITGTLSSHQQAAARRRAEDLLDDLANDLASLDDEVVQNDEFVHAFSVVSSAVIRTCHRGKRRLFARLLAMYTKRGDFGDQETTIFEEDYQILDELGPREFMVLAILGKHDKAARSVPSEVTLIFLNRIWEEFTTEVEEKAGVPRHELSSFLSRIGRTGLYQELTGGYSDYSGGKGMTTPLFDRVARNLELHNYRLLD